MSDKLLVLVTGATGQQGGAVANSLLDRGHRVRAMTRRPAAAADLVARGAEVVRGDFADEGSVVAAALGVDTVFLNTDSWAAGPTIEIANGIKAVDALARSGVGHVIYSSIASADRGTHIPHFDSKYAIERRLAASGLRNTIIAPVAYMENQLAPWAIGGLLAGTLAFALPLERALQQIAVADIGRFVAHVAEHRSEMIGRRIDIAGDVATGAEMATALSLAMERPVTYAEVPLAALRAQNPEAAIMFEWFDRVGYSADISGLRREFPEVGWTDFAAWAKSVDWRAISQRKAVTADVAK